MVKCEGRFDTDGNRMQAESESVSGPSQNVSERMEEGLVEDADGAAKTDSDLSAPRGAERYMEMKISLETFSLLCDLCVLRGELFSWLRPCRI